MQETRPWAGFLAGWITLGIEYLSENISLHPNPTNGMLYVDAENLQKVEVLNLFGQMVMSQEGSAVDLSGFGAGVYFVKITDGEGHVEVRKVVKE